MATRPTKRRSPAHRKPALPEMPHWDPVTHTLHFRGLEIKHFSHEALNQEMLLAAFQLAGWPRMIEFHFQPRASGNAKIQLRETVNTLNRSVAPHLHFFQEGNGRRVGWEVKRRECAS